MTQEKHVAMRKITLYLMDLGKSVIRPEMERLFWQMQKRVAFFLFLGKFKWWSDFGQVT